MKINFNSASIYEIYSYNESEQYILTFIHQLSLFIHQNIGEIKLFFYKSFELKWSPCASRQLETTAWQLGIKPN